MKDMIKVTLRQNKKDKYSEKTNKKYCYQTSNLIVGIEEQRGETSCTKMHSNFISLQWGHNAVQ